MSTHFDSCIYTEYDDLGLPPTAKVSPWPYGLQENTFKKNHLFGLKLYWRAFELENRHRSGLFLGYFRMIESRQGIPRGPRKKPRHYYHGLIESHYTFSPDGDRPDCFRHYEAIGLGSIPITQLDPFHYRHLAGGPVIYNNSNWNSTFWNMSVPNVTVNRNLVFAEYWMEYSEREVGRPLNWWDQTAKKPATLEDIASSVMRNTLD